MITKSFLTLLLLGSFLVITHSVYVPEVQACASTSFINHQIVKNGPQINQILNNAKIPDQPPFDQKIDGVRVQFNLTKIKQHFNMNWTGNVIKIEDYHTFVVSSSQYNNVTLTAEVQFKIAGAIKQKGTLNISVEGLKTDTTLSFQQPSCSVPHSGLGFNVQIKKLQVHPNSLVIKIQGHGIDNLIIKTVLNLLSTRLPIIIQNIALNQVNPAITQFTCNPVHQLITIKETSYIVVVNTTNVPHFVGKDLFAQVDITIINTVSNATNNEVENDNLPQKNLFSDKAELSGLASSNLLNSVLWLIDDCKGLQFNVTNSMLPDDAPIELKTTNLSILIPSLMKWPSKQVLLLIKPSSKFSHLYVRNGKIVAAIGLSVNFVVNNTGYQEQPVQTCISAGRCIEAINLNITIPFSAAIKIDNGNVARGLLHTISLHEIKVIESVIDVKTETLKKVLNIMVGSFRPQINKQLQEGITLPQQIVSLLQKYDIEQLFMRTMKDFAALGIKFKKEQ